MYRCLALAKLGSGFVAPNPMVGAVLVYNHNIIGEGFHEKSEKNKKVNLGGSYRRTLAKKYKKPKTKGDKNYNKKKRRM